MSASDCKMLKLSHAKREYLTRLQELGAPTQDQSVHSTRFKDILLSSIPRLRVSAKEGKVPRCCWCLKTVSRKYCQRVLKESRIVK